MIQALPNGFLLVIEGIDGAGKSTQSKLLAAALSGRGFDTVSSREPTDGRWGRLLRESANTGRLSPQEELDAFLKDRREHVEQFIRPNLRAGKVVILDRYYFSTMAYQGARGFDPDQIMRQNETFAPEPDLLVILDADPGLGRSRIGQRGDSSNLFESGRQLAKARAIFNSIQKPYLLRLEAHRDPLELREAILHKFHALIASGKSRPM